ncbi:Dual specificity protein kinase [Balamuthia mandrillaris]
MISDVNAEAREFWKEKFTSKEAIPEDSVDWKVFAKGLVEFLELEYPQGTVLDNVLEFKVLRLCLADKQDKVTLENFAAVIEWFGPFTKKKSEKTGANLFLANMMTIASLGFRSLSFSLLFLCLTYAFFLKKRGFWGDISSQHAEVKMAGQKPGYYMIRFSSQQPGYFTISAMSKDNTLKHFRIKHRAGLNFLLGNSEYPSIKALLRKHKDDLYLKHAVKGSPYAQLFLHHDEGPQSAYVEMLLT